MDVSKERLDVAVRPSGEFFSEANDKRAVSRLVKRLSTLNCTRVVVYRAVDNRIGRKVAIKTLTKGFDNDPEMLARFYDEAKRTGRLTHHAGGPRRSKARRTKP